jgi:hypothetical protein
MDMADGAVELADLASIEAGDADTFLAAAEHARVKAGCYYFPRLHFWKTSTRMLRWERHAGSILVYQVRQRKGGSRMDLYFPPLPFDPAALQHALQRMRDFNNDRSGRIVFVQESDALRIAREGFAISYRREEYIFNRAAVMALEGAGFSKLRKELSAALRQGLVETRPYTAADQPACLALTDAWRERLIANDMESGTSYRFTIACLTAGDVFPPSLLKGLVVEVDGQVRGFAFSGRLTSTLGYNFIGISDVQFRGLAYLLTFRLMAEFPNLIHFNDGSDNGRPGLREVKQRFRPVETLGIFSAQE